MAQEPTLRQRIGEKLQEIEDTRRIIQNLLVQLDNFEVEHKNRRDELKALVNEFSPALATELFQHWYK